MDRLAGDRTVAYLPVASADRVTAADGGSTMDLRLELAVESAGIGTWDLDPQTGRLAWSPRCRAMYDAPDARQSTYDELLSRIHPEDRESTHRAMQAALDPAGDGYFEAEHRTVERDGMVKWIGVRGRAFFEGRGEARRAVRFVGTAIDVTRRRTEHARLLAEAEEARVGAEIASRAKSQFLATVSHEIRTPINGIMGYAELLEIGLAGALTPAQHDYLDRVRRCGNHLTELVNEVLDLSKIDSGRMTVLHEPGTLADAATAALAFARPRAGERGIVISYRRHDEAPYVGDPERVKQILGNLLSNAVKFTEDGGRVTVSCGVARVPDAGAQVEHADEWSYVRVADTGIGIAPEKLDLVFEPFVQGEQEHTRQRGGTGLGLTISRRFARLMGGDLTAESVLGRGSTFTLWLPSAREPARAYPQAERRASTRYARGLARAGAALLSEIDGIMTAYVARLRSDPRTPHATELGEWELEDHTASFLADIAQALVVIEEAGGNPSHLMRDGTEIQRVIAERHGAQRHRLGWSEDAVHRDFELMREEVERTLRASDALAGHPETGPALDVLHRLTEHAERASIRGFRLASIDRGDPVEAPAE
jgi:signal transduction histidine kinase